MASPRGEAMLPSIASAGISPYKCGHDTQHLRKNTLEFRKRCIVFFLRSARMNLVASSGRLRVRLEKRG